MKIVLVNPPLTTEERYGVHFRSGGQTPPLGLACLAAVLHDHGIDVRIVDGTLFHSYEDVVANILGTSPDVVGLTASTVSIYNAARIAEMVKDRSFFTTTIIGGPHITAVPTETMARFPQFDLGVVGEAEGTILELLEAIDSVHYEGRLISTNSIVYRSRNDSIICTPRRPYIKNLDDLPMPAWDLLPDLATHYCPPVHTVKRLPAALLVTSRGCPMKCTFCARSVFGNATRAYSAEYVMQMIEELYYKYGIREFQFRDDNFLAFRKRLVELCERIHFHKTAVNHLDITWSIAGRVDMVNPRILSLLHDAGCWQIWYGVESGSQRILDVINKKTKLDKIRDAIRMTKEAGISPCGFFMLGMPTETPEDIEATIRFSKELELDEAHFSFCTPIPGCEMYATATQYGEFNDDWWKMSMWNPVFVPWDLTEKQLVKYWKKATLGFYLRPRIVWGYLKRIKSLRHVKIYGSGVLAMLEAVLVKKYVGE